MNFLAAGISKLLDPLRDFQLAGAKMSRCQVGRSASIGTSSPADLQFQVNQVFLMFFPLDKAVGDLQLHRPDVFLYETDAHIYSQEFQKQEP